MSIQDFSAKEKGVELSMTLSGFDSEEGRVGMDEKRFQQVVLNY